MTILKETAIETIKKLPDSCIVEDIMYELDLVAQVFEGIKDADEGKIFTTDEVLLKVKQWPK